MHYPFRYHNNEKRPRYDCRSFYRRMFKIGKIKGAYLARLEIWTQPPSVFEAGTYAGAMNAAIQTAFCSFLAARHRFQQKDHCYNHEPGYQCTDALLIFDDTSDQFRELLNTFQKEGEDGISRIIEELKNPAATRFYNESIPMIEEMLDYMYARLIVTFADSDFNTCLSDATLSREDVLKIGGLTPDHVQVCRELIKKGEDT